MLKALVSCLAASAASASKVKRLSIDSPDSKVNGADAEDIIDHNLTNEGRDLTFWPAVGAVFAGISALSAVAGTIISGIDVFNSDDNSDDTSARPPPDHQHPPPPTHPTTHPTPPITVTFNAVVVENCSGNCCVGCEGHITMQSTSADGTPTTVVPPTDYHGCYDESCFCDTIGHPGVQPNIFDSTCGSFFNCGAPGTVVAPTSCPLGTLFDAQRLICDFRHNVECAYLKPYTAPAAK